MNVADKIALANKVAFHLQGQCLRTLADELEDVGHPELEDDEAFCRFIDDRVFVCTGCGWWCSVDESNNDNAAGEPFCDDCCEEGEE